MIPLALALVTAMSDCTPRCTGAARTLCCERHAAYDEGDSARVFTLIEDEVAVVQAERSTRARPIGAGFLQPLCDPIEAGFNLCNEWLPERGCASHYLNRHIQVGCLADPAERARHANMQAMHSRQRMDYAAALAHLQEAELRGWSLWLLAAGPGTRAEALLSVATSMATRAEIAAHLRSPEVVVSIIAAIEYLLAPPAVEGRAGAVADIRNLLAWALLLAHEADRPVGDPHPQLMSALETFTLTRATRWKADNVRINLALAALHRGDTTEARRWSNMVKPSHLGDEGRLWLRLVQLRVALLDGRLAGTTRLLAELTAIATRARTPMAAWFAAWARGLQAEARDRPTEAIAAYAAAEAELERHAHLGRSGALGTLADRRYLAFGAATRRLVQLQIDAGDADQAAWTARHARSRALRMAAREVCHDAEFIRPGDPRPGELRLLYFRVSPQAAGSDATRWIGFAITAHGVRAETLTLDTIPHDLHDDLAGDDPDRHRERWSAALLLPFSDEIAAATAIEVLPTEALHRVPFHALPWDGGILLEHATVVYGLDLETCGQDLDPQAGRALVLRGEDPGLEAEADAIATTLERGPFVTDRVVVHDLVGSSPLLTGSHAIAHVVAHGTRANLGDLFGSDDRLDFGGENILRRQTILAAPRSPALVYLSACESSVDDAETLGGGISLAHAFLLRGARYVVGPVQRIDGEVTRRVAVEFYAALTSRDLTDTPEAWREGYLSARRALPGPSLESQLRMLRLYAR